MHPLIPQEIRDVTEEVVQPGLDGNFLLVDEVNYEVFWPRCMNWDLEQDYSTRTCAFAANHPGRDANRPGETQAPDVPYRQPNWLYYWAQVADVDDGRLLKDVPYQYNGLQAGDDLGYTPKVLKWISYAGPIDDILFYPLPGIPGRPDGSGDTALVGITKFLATARHERVHVSQVWCNNQCASPAGPSGYADPVLSTTAATGWSFNEPTTSTLWNHYADADGDGSLGAGDGILDTDADDACDPNYCPLVLCLPQLAGNYANLCDPDPAVDGGLAWGLQRDETERQAYAAAQDRTDRDERVDSDWGSPGRQHLDPKGVEKDLAAADKD